MSRIELCPHSRPAFVPLSSLVRGIDPCDDCYAEEWARVGKVTIIGVLLMMILIWVPAIALLCGAFW